MVTAITVVMAATEAITDMSYSRDPDRATRGPGAIAALDGAGRGERHRQREQANATRQRDRKMVAVVRGALGRIDLNAKAGAYSKKPPTPTSTPVMTPPIVKQQPPATVSPITTTTLPPVMRFPDPGPVAPLPQPVNVTVALTPPIIKWEPEMYVPPTTPTTLPTTTPLPGITKTVVVGGGGGGGTGGGVSQPVKQVAMMPPIKFDPEMTVPSSNAPDSSMSMSKMLPLLGGAALVLYLLLRKKGKS